MEKFDRTIRYINLYNIYKSLLTHTQQEIAGDYFLADLSITEVAENRNVSRSAVEDALKKACQKLDEYESNLRLFEKRDNLLKITSKLKERALNNSEIEELKAIEKELEYGI